jgi:hypothetical protein
MPEHYPTHDEGVTQAVDTRTALTPTIHPAQFGSQFEEYPMHLPITQRLT